MRILISWPKGKLFGVLDQTPTAEKVVAALPCSASANTWGEEVYFSLPANAKLEADAHEVVPPGTICFWVQGQSLALPFGPTPASHGDECRLVTKVNLLGKLEGDPRQLKTVRDGDEIRVEKA